MEKLKKRLYAREAGFGERKRRARLSGGKIKDVPSEWKKPPPRTIRRRISPVKVILLLSVLLVLIFSFIFIYFWALDIGFISAQNIGLEIRGPAYVKGGEEAVLDILIENKNDEALELADLVLTFPSGTYSTEGEKLIRQRLQIGTVKPGEAVRKRVALTFFGKEGDIKKVSAELEYRLEKSNAIFVKDAEYQVKINQPAIGVSISMPAMVNIGKEVEIEVSVVSNAEAPVKDAFLEVNYPPGFTFKEADLEPAEGENVWRLGDLAPLQEREVKIIGTLEGQHQDEKAFRASVGVKDAEGNLIAFGSTSKTLTLKKPYLDLDIFAGDKEANDVVAYSGDGLRLQVVWQNNLDVPVKDAKITLKIKGKAIDESTISVNDGYYRTFDKSLVWNPSSLATLSLIKPKDGGRAVFSFQISDPLPVSQAEDKNFTLSLDAVIEGNVIMEGSPSHIKSEVSKKIKIGSKVQLAASSLHFSGVFKNSGPMPPQAGKETTYTIVWSVGGNVNDIENASVKSSLPSYVRWLGKISPEGEKVKFNENTGELVWDIGDLKAGTGILMPAREVSFQISFLPSPSQVNDTPELTGEISFEGKDSFTNKVVRQSKPPLTTRLVNDPMFVQGQERVVK